MFLNPRFDSWSEPPLQHSGIPERLSSVIWLQHILQYPFLKMGTSTLVYHSMSTVSSFMQHWRDMSAKTAQKCLKPSTSQGKSRPLLVPCCQGTSWIPKQPLIGIYTSVPPNHQILHPPLSPYPTHHQVVISWQLCSIIHLSVQYIRQKMWSGTRYTYEPPNARTWCLLATQLLIEQAILPNHSQWAPSLAPGGGFPASGEVPYSTEAKLPWEPLLGAISWPLHHFTKHESYWWDKFRGDQEKRFSLAPNNKRSKD